MASARGISWARCLLDRAGEQSCIGQHIVTAETLARGTGVADSEPHHIPAAEIAPPHRPRGRPRRDSTAANSGPYTGKKVKELRESLGMTQLQFAEFLKVPVGTVAGWEKKADRKPQPAVQALLCEIAQRCESLIKVHQAYEDELQKFIGASGMSRQHLASQTASAMAP